MVFPVVVAIGAIINFNRNFNPDPSIKGDFKPISRGATSLIAKEVLGTQLDNFAQTLTPEEKIYVKFRNLVRERAKVRDLIVEDIVMDDAACDAVDQQQAQAQQAQQAQQTKMVEAQIREILAKSVKELAQAGKNQSTADADTANVILSALEKGVDPLALIQGATNGQQSGQASNGGGIGATNADQSAGTGNAGAMQATGPEISQAGPAPAAMPVG